MIGITNVGGGGGMAYAYIGVIYTPGETVTCTDGNRTYRAKDTSGLYVFPVPYAATWVVTSTDGESVNSESVVITNLWQDEIVDLSFDGTVFNNGKQYVNVTGGWAYNPNVYIGSPEDNIDTSTIDNHIRIASTARGKTCYVTTGNAIDITGATSLTISYIPSSSGYGRMYLLRSNTGYITSPVIIDFAPVGSQAGDYTYTFSQSSGVFDNPFYYFAFYGTYQYSVNVSKVKLNYA